MNTTLRSEWSSPSNIALVKYWGKIPVQIPANPSISFTLSKSLTHFKMEATLLSAPVKNIELDFNFEGALNEKFKTKILKFLETKLGRFPWLMEFKITIYSENTFPHSSGIASSASSMSALCLCLLSLDQEISGQRSADEDFFQEASDLARQASGSASRSVYPYLVSWGEIDSIPGTSNLFSSPVLKDDIHPMFHHFCDSIIIVDANEKSVSSRAGHALMENHPFKEERFKRARSNLDKLINAMKTGDMEIFIEVVEEEALMLHALMMTSTPSYILLRPDSLLLIEKIRAYRLISKIPVSFTIDAGPNIHLLYPIAHKAQVMEWMNAEFNQFRIIHDEVGMGPKVKL